MPVQSTLAWGFKAQLQRVLAQLVYLLRLSVSRRREFRHKFYKVLRNNPSYLVIGGLVTFTFAARSRNRSWSFRPLDSDEPRSRKLDNGARELWVPYKNRLARVVVPQTPEELFDAHQRLFLNIDNDAGNILVSEKANLSKRRYRQTRFFKQFRALFTILLPSVFTPIAGLMALHMALLTFRTYLSLKVANLDGHIVRNLIAAKGKEFVQSIVEWLLLAIPASYTNAMIRYLEAKISLEFRTKLMRYIHDLYIGPRMEYYKLTNLDGAIEGADHYITSDLTNFCDAAASLYSNLGKPTIDLVFFAYQLSHNLGSAALLGIFANYGVTAWLLKHAAPSFGRLAAKEAALEGEYRGSQQRIITNSEEIAFYDGAPIERQSLLQSYKKLRDHIARVLRVTAAYNIVEDYVLKYSWSASGFLFASVPVFLPTWTGDRLDRHATLSAPNRERSRMGDFITNKRLMLSMADAGGRIMYSIKDLTQLAGYTGRLYDLVAALHRVRANAYHRLAVDEDIDYEEYSLADVKGEYHLGCEEFSLREAPVVVPGLGRDLSAGEVLIEPITFKIQQGEHLLITGANGVGKSSIARMAARMWPLYRGVLCRPTAKKIRFLPQRPYFSCSTLRDQIIYPATHAQMLEAGITDDNLMDILRQVKLDYLPEREGGFNAIKEWKDVFSGGEKQRMLFTRLLYAKPQFAVIDEGTSAVSQDVEGLLYEVCKRNGITLITISHRVSLMKYHTATLDIGLGPEGNQWKFEHTETDEARLTVEKDISQLREKIAKYPALRKRREEILQLLGVPAKPESGAIKS